MRMAVEKPYKQTFSFIDFKDVVSELAESKTIIFYEWTFHFFITSVVSVTLFNLRLKLK